ncbi:Transposon TX1 uncharacterized 149 kDa protein [Vitis vinifera]|uniref:Transposon TX1 uncharacterized 149 kDa protein n=1 Tax=Vitis vinifera TaxID=29760 RepID=A0A438H406_VITVI|nr:Transposon TX1 uncharacterized 149 kDa protein [Vitis vinifera]
MGSHKFMRGLQFVKAKAKEWNKLSFGVLNEKKKSILKDLANLDAIEQDGGLTSELRNRKYIKSLENERGLVLNNAESITEEILLYFEKLYANPIGESWSIEDLDWSLILEESAIIFQDCWDVIKEDLVRVFAEFHRSGVINQSTNASFIVLLPKKSTTKKISDFRPISLITSLYKIIAKVLSGRLKEVLHETIHSTQGAFVQGRQIMDAVLIANEIVDEEKTIREEGVVFKIDFEKAYDHVRWDFLDQVLEKKGFSPKWRKWMNGCLSSVSYAVLVNGSAKGWVKASRGLRQGDPLSPFLFTLVADVLSRMLLRAEERNMLEGFRVGRNRTRVSHLQFADDTIFFSNTRRKDLQTLKSLLLAFGIFLDLRAGGFWDPVIERISRRLDGGKSIPILWREDNSHPILPYPYALLLSSLFKLPASVAAKNREGNGCGGTLERVQLYASGHTKHLWFTLQWLGCQHNSQMVTSLSLEGYFSSLSGVFLVYSICGRKWGKNSFLGRFVVGGPTFGIPISKSI